MITASVSVDLNEDCEQKSQSICRFGCTSSSFVTINDKYARRILEKVNELHMNFECPYRSIKCEACTSTIRAKDLAEHTKGACAMRQVQCLHSGCGIWLSNADMPSHLTLTCKYRLVDCVQGCGEMVNNLMLSQHTSNSCKNRIISCPKQCGSRILYVDLDRHLKWSCSITTKR
jgi:hypothetical protein